MDVHRIHLKGPWEIEWPGPDGPGERRAHLPAAWRALFGAAAGTARFRRWFHQPTNLDPGERVFVVFEGMSGNAVVSLNGCGLGTIAAGTACAEFDVTTLLQERNALEVELGFDPAARGGTGEAAEAAAGAGAVWAVAALEIRSEP